MPETMSHDRSEFLMNEEDYERKEQGFSKVKLEEPFSIEESFMEEG